MKTLRRLLPYLRPERSLLAVAYVCMVLLALTTASYAALMGPVIKYVFTGNLLDVLRSSDGSLRPAIQALVPQAWIENVESLDPARALWVLPAFIVAIACIKGLAEAGQFFLFGRASQRILVALRGDAFGALLAQPPSFYTQRSHGDLLSRLTHDANQVEQGFFNAYGSLLRDTLTLIGLLAFVFYSDAKLALVTFITVPVAVVPLVRFTKWLKRVARRGHAAQGDINAVAYEALAGVNIVQAFGNEAHEQDRMHAAATGYYRQMLKSYLIRAARTPTMEILGAVALAALVALLGHHVQTRGVDAAHYISFLGAIFLMYDPLKKLGRVGDALAAAAAATDRIFEIIEQRPAISDRPGARECAVFGDRVRFEHVSFRYGDAAPWVLKDVSFELRQGQCVALVGASGAGKSTLANLLPRFYDVVEGAIRIDDRDIRDLTLRSLRRQMSLVTQETFLFNATVHDNIAYGATSADRAAVVAAAEAAYADAFIGALPQGYDTVIGERGVRLSGGQRQRLAIARALLRNSPLIILDEATSHLDVESERHIQAALQLLMQGRTTLVIAHRLSTVRRADLICVLQNGHIVERGTHEALIAQRQLYARLYELQFATEPQRLTAEA